MPNPRIIKPASPYSGPFPSVGDRTRSSSTSSAPSTSFKSYEGYSSDTPSPSRKGSLLSEESGRSNISNLPRKYTYEDEHLNENILKNQLSELANRLGRLDSLIASLKNKMRKLENTEISPKNEKRTNTKKSHLTERLKKAEKEHHDTLNEIRNRFINIINKITELDAAASFISREHITPLESKINTLQEQIDLILEQSPVKNKIKGWIGFGSEGQRLISLQKDKAVAQKELDHCHKAIEEIYKIKNRILQETGYSAFSEILKNKIKTLFTYRGESKKLK